MSAADALQEWLDKSQWFKPQTHELGMHVLDAIYNRLQYYVGLAARRNIELQLVQQILDDPNTEFTSSDMEYWTPLHDKLYQQLVNNPYQQAIDNELVLTHLGIAEPNCTLEHAKQKLTDLICWHIEVATDPKTNGGYKLTKV